MSTRHIRGPLVLGATTVKISAGAFVFLNEAAVVLKKTVPATTAVSLPANPALNQINTVRDGNGDSATYNITVTDPQAATINGAASYVISTNYASVSFQWDGTAWGVMWASGQTGAVDQVDVVTGASATGEVAQKISPTATGGLKTIVVDKTVSPAAVETAVFTVPAGSVIRLVQGNVQTALTGGGTTTTWSLGVAADPDKYGTAGYPVQADALTANSKSSWVNTPTHLAAAEPIVLSGAATGGAADGDTALTVGSVRVVIVYDTYESLANA